MLDCRRNLNTDALPDMSGKKGEFISSLAAFTGVTIGVNIFALPYLYAGSLATSLLILAATALILMSLYTMYIDLILEKGIGLHQLPGVAGRIWGKRVKNIVAVILMFGRTGIMFLYTIILGSFGSLILESVFNVSLSPVLIGSVATFLASLAITRKIRFLSTISLYLSAVIITIIGSVSVLGIASSWSLSASNILDLFSRDMVFDNTKFLGSLRTLGPIYGVTIGAMSGIAGIPALKKLSSDKETLRAATRIGTCLVMVLYALFAMLVILYSDTVSQDALHGLGDAWWWVPILAIAGFLSVLTSYLGVGFSFFEVYHQDYLLSKPLSWILTFAPPITLYFIGIDDFARIAAVIGGLVGGTEAVIILASYWKIEDTHRHFPASKKAIAIVTAIVLTIGLLLTI
jgi:amino acid permease